MTGYVPTAVRRSLRTIGEHVRDQRRVLGLTMAVVAQRADISVTTLSKVEHGESVRLEAFLAVLRVLGLLDRVVAATDPLTTELGRLRASRGLPQRVRMARDE